MNFASQICAAALLLIIFIFYCQQKHLPLRTSQAFLITIIVTFLCVLLDIYSVIVIDNYRSYSPAYTGFICKAYLISLVCVGFFSLRYICIDVYSSNHKNYIRCMHIYYAAAIIGSVIIYTLPIHHSKELGSDAVYTYGSSVSAAYIIVLIFIINVLATAIKHRNAINPQRSKAVTIWMIFWIASAVVQFFYREILIVSFSSCIGILILFIMLETPLTNIDRTSGLFNYNALVQYMQQYYNDGRQFSSVVFVRLNSFQNNLTPSVARDINYSIVRFFSDIPGAVTFKSGEDKVTMMFDDANAASDAFELVQEKIRTGWGTNSDIVIPAGIICIPDSTIAGNAAEMLYLTSYARQCNREFLENGLVFVDINVLNEMKDAQRIEQLVKDSIDNDTIAVYYQPIYSTKTGRFSSAEALVRIKDEDGNILPPAKFIDIAEKNSSIIKLGELIFEHVCRFIKKHNLRQYGIDYIEVNLSAVQCSYEQLAERYISILKKYDVAPDMINLEITESASIGARNALINNMHALLDYGVHFSLDDFGTGQSNLNYIIDMPVDIIKFDRSMSMSYFNNSKGKYIMDASINMIHDLQLEIVSEGIETAEQFEAMNALGVSYIQGYYFSKPLCCRDFIEFLKEHNTDKQD